MSRAEVEVLQTSPADGEQVLWLFKKTLELNGRMGYSVWESIDEAFLKRDMLSGHQYKVISGNDILCVFSIQLNDALIWGDRETNDAVYLHRIVTHPLQRGKRQFAKVIDWAKQFAQLHRRSAIRMDTWSSNTRLISYYISYGFQVVGHVLTPDDPLLPIQNRNLQVTLLELPVI